ncbi:flagellar assembly protein FliH [Psychromonas sp. MME1]|uniref:flagellar assembly protein FliH n=1 Tax=Psychromonas sp. MME1 TaxID=3231032 RepID=UPI0034E2D02E
MKDDKPEFVNWHLPEMGETEDDADEVSLFGKPAAWYSHEKISEEEEALEDEPTPLTLEDIEAIRLSAYEDGFKEGKEAGYSAGHEEGKAAGFIEGKQEGTELGLSEGRSEGQTQIDEQVNHWQRLIERLHNPLEKLDDSVEYQLVRLATALAEQITRCEVQTNPQIILHALKQAVEALPVSEQTIHILLHPDDLLFVQAAYPPSLCEKRGWDLQAEPALARGDCQIQTKISSVDYLFSHRIDQVLKQFFKENHDFMPDKNDDSDLSNNAPIDNIDQPEIAPPDDVSDSDELNPNSDVDAKNE